MYYFHTSFVIQVIHIEEHQFLTFSIKKGVSAFENLKRSYKKIFKKSSKIEFLRV